MRTHVETCREMCAVTHVAHTLTNQMHANETPLEFGLGHVSERFRSHLAGKISTAALQMTLELRGILHAR